MPGPGDHRGRHGPWSQFCGVLLCLAEHMPENRVLAAFVTMVVVGAVVILTALLLGRGLI